MAINQKILDARAKYPFELFIGNHDTPRRWEASELDQAVRAYDNACKAPKHKGKHIMLVDWREKDPIRQRELKI